MGINKLIWQDETVFDISDTTAVASDVAEGKIFYGADGDQKVGTATGGGGGYSEYAIGGSLVGGTATGYVMDPNITKIKQYSFAMCETMSSLDIPDSVTVLEDAAFYGCTAEIAGGENVEEVGTGSFYECESTSLDVGPKVWKANMTAFSRMPNITALELPLLTNFGTSPSATTAVATSTFAGCSNLEAVDLTSATWIPNRAFQDCTNLFIVYSPNIGIIAPYAFEGCTSLVAENLNLDQVGSIGEYAFRGCSSLNAELDLPVLETIGAMAFANADLKSLKARSLVQGTLPTMGNIPSLVHLESEDIAWKCTTINASTFGSTGNLEDIILPNVATYNIQALPAYSQTPKLKNLKFKWAGSLSGSTISGGVKVSNFATTLANSRVFYADNGYLLAAYRASSGSVVYIHTIEDGVISSSPVVTLSGTTVSQYSFNGKVIAFKRSGTTSSQAVQVAVIG